MPGSPDVDTTHFDLLRRPAIHAQGLHFGDVRAHLPVQCTASHAEKDSQLYADPSALFFARSQRVRLEFPAGWTYVPAGPSCDA